MEILFRLPPDSRRAQLIPEIGKKAEGHFRLTPSGLPLPDIWSFLWLPNGKNEIAVPQQCPSGKAGSI